MRPKILSSRLTLNKKTISHLDQGQMKEIQGQVGTQEASSCTFKVRYCDSVYDRTCNCYIP